MTTATQLITPQAIRELSPSLVAFAYRRLGQRQDAEDLVQDTWVSALRSAPTFEGRSSLRTWLVTILSRRIAERYRRARAWEPFDEDSFVALPEQAPERLDLELAAQVATSALASLTDDERVAVTLCDVNDFDREQACESLGVTRGHLRVLLHRGRHKLEAELTARGIAA
ncbi:MAG: polymerase sigma-54 factor RpoN [Myxococcaceae bacterium]|nr:polymerase sigma-54 factor RpoN [Myxococcaceae bacterium]